MKIISQRECEEWVKTKLGENLELASVLVGYTHSVTYHLPIDAGKKTALARVLSRSIDARQQGLLWITAWGIFPSSENMALFDAYRRSLGENRPIHETPGHVFDQSDLQQIECLLDLAPIFIGIPVYSMGRGLLPLEPAMTSGFPSMPRMRAD